MWTEEEERIVACLVEHCYKFGRAFLHNDMGHYLLSKEKYNDAMKHFMASNQEYESSLFVTRGGPTFSTGDTSAQRGLKLLIDNLEGIQRCAEKALFEEQKIDIQELLKSCEQKLMN